MLSSIVGGLTPPIDKFKADAARRIFLGGFWSSVVYSNIHAQAAANANWILATKNYWFQCAFLFRPTINVLKVPLVAIVPESMFATHFMKDEFSIVKIFARKYFGTSTVSIPGAVKSTELFTLAPQYFLGSTHFSARQILTEGFGGALVNPGRFVRGASLTSIGTAMIFNAFHKFMDDDSSTSSD